MTPADALKMVRDGGRLSRDMAEAVYVHATTEDLEATAKAVRARHATPGVATYLVDRNVNYTNVCITDCTFCEFYRRPGDKEAYVLPKDAMRAKLSELRAAGGTRVLLQGGHNPDLRIEWYEELLRFLTDEFPDIRPDAFSPPEIEHLARLEGLSTRDVLVRLREAGLKGLPGGGGEMLDDEIRRRVSPKKTMSAEWLRIMGEAHELGLSTTVTMVFGFGEEVRHRCNAFAAIRDRQDLSLSRFGRGFVGFASWPLQHESRYGELWGLKKGVKLGAEPDEYLRHAAFARVWLDNVPHMQASWPTMGVDVAARALLASCDDMGGTMMEENVVSQAGSVHASASETALRDAIVAAGFTPRKRDTAYALL
jgi:cyclic dehypoxanthinyl futalosine synthase